MFLVQIENQIPTGTMIKNQQILVDIVNLTAFLDAHPNSRLTFEVIKEWKPNESKRNEPKPQLEPLSR